MLMAPEGKTRWQVVSTVSLTRTESAIGRFWRPFGPPPASRYSHLLRWLHPPRSARPRRPTSSPAPSTARSSRSAACLLAKRNTALAGRDTSSCKVATCTSVSRAIRAAVKDQIYFQSNGYRYIVYDRTLRRGFGADGHNDPQSSSGLVVQKGGRIVSSTRCGRRGRPAREDERRGTLRTERRLCRSLMSWSPM